MAPTVWSSMQRACDVIRLFLIFVVAIPERCWTSQFSSAQSGYCTKIECHAAERIVEMWLDDQLWSAGDEEWSSRGINCFLAFLIEPFDQQVHILVLLWIFNWNIVVADVFHGFACLVLRLMSTSHDVLALPWLIVWQFWASCVLLTEVAFFCVIIMCPWCVCLGDPTGRVAGDCSRLSD